MMSQNVTFTIVLPADVDRADREALRLAIEPYAQVQDSASKDPLTALATFVVVVGAVGTVVGTINSTIELAEKINAWRRARAARGLSTSAQLQRPGQAPLDLDPYRTSDQELLAWLNQPLDR
jgi:hypothetical protein